MSPVQSPCHGCRLGAQHQAIRSQNIITRATNRKRRDRNCSSTYCGVPGTARKTGRRKEAVRMLQLCTLTIWARNREDQPSSLYYRNLHTKVFQILNNIRQNKIGIMKMWNNITMRIRSPIYPKRFWPEGANKTENAERIIKEKLLMLSIFCVSLYTHQCLVSVIPFSVRNQRTDVK